MAQKSAVVTVDEFLKEVEEKNPNEPEFLQAVEEVVRSVYPIYSKNHDFVAWAVLKRLMQPEYIITFKIVWEDDNHNVQVNTGHRIQYSSMLGPYKGGLRFHPSVNLSKLKFLGFEQVFKNALTGLNMGGAKGGSDFEPKGKSDKEVMRFCHRFMEKLYPHIGPDKDVPAGDIGVGLREIGYLFRHYSDITKKFTAGVLTGKDPEWGGSLLRPEATGYGNVIFAAEMLEIAHRGMAGKTIAISGSGNVAQYAAELAIDMDAKVLTMSDSSGYIFAKNGLDKNIVNFILELKNKRRGRIKEVAEHFDNIEYFEGKSPWQYIRCDVALPCATENELNEDDAKALIENNLILVAEGANMPCTPEAVKLFHKYNILFAPGKAANAGGVAVSGLEMSQDSSRQRWTKEMVFQKLQKIMKGIHNQCLKHGKQRNKINYVNGANIAGFLRVANAMIQQGI